MLHLSWHWEFLSIANRTFTIYRFCNFDRNYINMIDIFKKKKKRNLTHNYRTQNKGQMVEHNTQIHSMRTAPTDGPYTTPPAHYTCRHFTQMAWLFGKVKSLCVDITGHSEDLLEYSEGLDCHQNGCTLTSLYLSFSTFHSKLRCSEWWSTVFDLNPGLYKWGRVTLFSK